MKKGKVRKIGNSLGLTLPLEYIRSLDLHDGDEIAIHIHGETLVIERYNAQLLDEMQSYRQELARFKHTFKALD